MEKVQARMQLGTPRGCMKEIALLIQRKFPMVPKLSFMMRSVSP
jgi:hypothetical protein